jgi:2-polyprenyl-6-methoxyphenol hydroxylase-like FAD-dependent oxidoreductase
LKLPESNKVIVVGAGPVGLIASLLLSKYYVPHVLVEQLADPDDHPQAHFSFHRESPYFLPSSFVVLMRPDGHIAWMHVPNRFSEPYTQFAAKELSNLK